MSGPIYDGQTRDLPEREKLRNERRTCFELMIRYRSVYWLRRWLSAIKKR